MVDVFLSYARADQARVELLVHALKRAGLVVFWDRMLEGGGYEAQLRQQIQASGVVVLAGSEAASSSQYVSLEVQLGDSKLVACRFDDVPVKNLPIAAQKLDIIDLRNWSGDWDNAGIAHLIARAWAARAGTLETSVHGHPREATPGAGTVNNFNDKVNYVGLATSTVIMKTGGD